MKKKKKKKMTRLPSANDGGHESSLDLMEMFIEIILQSIEVEPLQPHWIVQAGSTSPQLDSLAALCSPQPLISDRLAPSPRRSASYSLGPKCEYHTDL